MVVINDLAYKILARTEDATHHLQSVFRGVDAPRVTELELLVKKYNQIAREVEVVTFWLSTAIDDIRNDTYLSIDNYQDFKEDDPDDPNDPDRNEDDDNEDDDNEDDEQEEQETQQSPANIHTFKIT